MSWLHLYASLYWVEQGMYEVQNYKKKHTFFLIFYHLIVYIIPGLQLFQLLILEYLCAKLGHLQRSLILNWHDTTGSQNNPLMHKEDHYVCKGVNRDNFRARWLLTHSTAILWPCTLRVYFRWAGAKFQYFHAYSTFTHTETTPPQFSNMPLPPQWARLK